MNARRRRKLIFGAVALLIITAGLVSIFRYAVMPTAGAKMTQHTFGDDVIISMSGYGTLSKASVAAFLVSGQTSLRVAILFVRIESMNYQVGLPYSATASLPTLDLPRTVEVQTFFDQGNFDLLRTHQNVTVRVVIEGTWSIGSTSFGFVSFDANVCCIQPF